MPYKNKQDLYNYQIKRWIDRKIKAIDYKGGKCESCGYSKCYWALEFHHNNPIEKEFDWNKLRLRKWENILFELDKCSLLCSNCHKEEHHKLNINGAGSRTRTDMP